MNTITERWKNSMARKILRYQKDEITDDNIILSFSQQDFEHLMDLFESLPNNNILDSESKTKQKVNKEMNNKLKKNKKKWQETDDFLQEMIISCQGEIKPVAFDLRRLK